MERLSFNKKEGDFSKIDQQHLSNCWWFVKIFDKSKKAKDVLEVIKRELLDRFNGQLMPYRPHVANKDEIKQLEKKGMFQESVGELHTHNIIFEGAKIGEIRLTF